MRQGDPDTNSRQKPRRPYLHSLSVACLGAVLIIGGGVIGGYVCGERDLCYGNENDDRSDELPTPSLSPTKLRSTDPAVAPAGKENEDSITRPPSIATGHNSLPSLGPEVATDTPTSLTTIVTQDVPKMNTSDTNSSNHQWNNSDVTTATGSFQNSSSSLWRQRATKDIQETTVPGCPKSILS